ncbi:MAG: OmpA/MotB family protein [Methylococcales bacterium]
MHRSETLRKSSPAFPSDESWVYAAPWDEDGPGQQSDTDNWLLSYADMLTLMLTLLVMLLAFNQIQNKHADSAHIKNALEVIPDPNQVKIPQPGHSNTEPVSNSTEIPASLHYPTGQRRFDSPSGQNNIADRIMPSIWSQQEGMDDLADRNLRNQLLDRTLKDLDLSIHPIDILDFPELTSTAFPTVVPVESPPTRKFDQQGPRGLTKQTDVERYQRLISEQKLDGLIELSQAQNAVRMEVNERILFETGEADLKPNGITLLDELANLLQNQPGNIHIEGHTDNVPIATARFPSNWELSASRASSVARYLIDHSVDPDRLRAIGFADTKPRAGNQTPEGRSKNRRVSLVIEMNDSQNEQIH